MIPESIKKLANKVRNEIYGRDVRESIAQSMEVSGETSNEANERSKDTAGRQTDVENRFDDQIAGNTDIDEVIDARRPEGGDSYPTLRKRLDDEHKEVTTQLAQIATLVGRRYEGETFDNGRIVRAIHSLPDSGGKILLPKGKFHIDPQISLEIPDNIVLEGSGANSTLLYTSERRLNSLIKIKGSNIKIHNIGFDLNEYDSKSNLTEVACIEANENCSNLNILDCKFVNGYAGIWLNPLNGSKINNVTIKKCVLLRLRHHIYLGYTKLSEENRVDLVSDVLINNNIISDGLYQGDGIKTSQNCRDIIITDNIIRNHERDAIDLYTSGDNIVVSNNILSDNGDKGIDIKSRLEPEYPSEYYGHNRRMIITNNLIDNNRGHGIGVAFGGVYLVDIANNSFTGNHFNAVMVYGRNVNIVDNLFFNNCLKENVGSAPINIYGEEPNYSKNINISSNQILNNGNELTQTAGIRIREWSEDINITNNVIINDSTKAYDNQKIGLFVANGTNRIRVKNNIIKGHKRNVFIKKGAGVIGETISVDIGTHEITENYIDKNILVYNDTFSVVDVSFINDLEIFADLEKYIRLRIRKRVKGELKPESLAVLSTEETNLKANTPIKIDNFHDIDINRDDNKINKDEVLVFTIQGVGGVTNIKDGKILINYISH